jgi:hypothetical protein
MHTAFFFELTVHFSLQARTQWYDEEVVLYNYEQGNCRGDPINSFRLKSGHCYNIGTFFNLNLQERNHAHMFVRRILQKRTHPERRMPDNQNVIYGRDS